MKGRFVWVFVVVFLGVLTSSCKTPGPTGLSDQDRAAILKVSEDGIKLFNAPDRNFEAAVKFYYTEDAMTLSPNEPAVQGRASQIAWYKAYPPFELAEKILELDGRGDLAYARLTYSLKVKMPGAEEPVVDTGKGMEIWKKQKDGSWKVSCDVFNSDLPMATPSEPGAVEQQKSGSAEQELIDLEQGWANAQVQVKLDLAFLDRILADDYVQSNWDGTSVTKAQVLASLKSKEDVITYSAGDDYKVRVYGDAAVVTGRWTGKETIKGKDNSGQYRWTDTWIRKAGRWQCVASHNSKIS